MQDEQTYGGFLPFTFGKLTDWSINMLTGKWANILVWLFNIQQTFTVLNGYFLNKMIIYFLQQSIVKQTLHCFFFFLKRYIYFLQQSIASHFLNVLHHHFSLRLLTSSQSLVFLLLGAASKFQPFLKT